MPRVSAGTGNDDRDWQSARTSPRVRDQATAKGAEKIRFRSALSPPYLRKSKPVEELLPWLYLKGISTGDFSEALVALLGPDAEGLSASTITRLKATWWEEYQNRQRAPICNAPISW